MLMLRPVWWVFFPLNSENEFLHLSCVHTLDLLKTETFIGLYTLLCIHLPASSIYSSISSIHSSVYALSVVIDVCGKWQVSIEFSFLSPFHSFPVVFLCDWVSLSLHCSRQFASLFKVFVWGHNIKVLFTSIYCKAGIRVEFHTTVYKNLVRTLMSFPWCGLVLFPLSVSIVCGCYRLCRLCSFSSVHFKQLGQVHPSLSVWHRPGPSYTVVLRDWGN